MSLTIAANTNCGSPKANAQTQGNENQAIALLRSLNNAQLVYSNECGNQGYATALNTLRMPPAAGQPGYLGEEFKGSGESVEYAGYRFRLMAGRDAIPGPVVHQEPTGDVTTDCNGNPIVNTYYAVAEPITFGVTGNRSFATSTAMTIWELAEAKAPSEPFGAPARPIH